MIRTTKEVNLALCGDGLAHRSGLKMKYAEIEKANDSVARPRRSAFHSWSSIWFAAIAMLVVVKFLVPCPLSYGQVIRNPVQTQVQNPVQNQIQNPVQNQVAQPTKVAAAEPAKLAKPDTETKFDAKRAFEHLKSVCDIGPRVSASAGMKKQQKYLKKHFDSIEGAFFYTQPFRVRSPYTGKAVQLDNIIVQFHPKRKKRLLVCCHHDTRPFPDSDPINPRGVFLGANDGGSGVGLLCELGRHLQNMDGDYGVDLVFFDGEEFVIHRPRDRMFLGSTYFAQQYAAGKLKWKYQFGILVDMVADKDLQIYLEGNSLGYADGLTRSVWTVAKDLGVKEFIPQQRHQIRDDHLPLNEIARIQTVDIIDFDYPNPTQGNSYWHTQKDSVENCSAESLGKVGSVVLDWLRQVQKLNKGK